MKEKYGNRFYSVVMIFNPSPRLVLRVWDKVNETQKGVKVKNAKGLYTEFWKDGRAELYAQSIDEALEKAEARINREIFECEKRIVDLQEMRRQCEEKKLNHAN